MIYFQKIKNRQAIKIRKNALRNSKRMLANLTSPDFDPSQYPAPHLLEQDRKELAEDIEIIEKEIQALTQ